jgi:putative Mn2+ efflux pump MntP
MDKNKSMYLLIWAVIGGCLGGYISYINNNYLYSAIGPVVGIYIGLYFNKFARIGNMDNIRTKQYDNIFVAIGMVLSSLSVVAYFYTKQIEMLISCIFFFGGSLYLIIIKPKDNP